MARPEKQSTTEWLRLDQVAARIAGRGYDGSVEIVRCFSDARLRRADIGKGPLLRFPERPPIGPDFIKGKRGWLVRPTLDVPASTIVAPLRPPGSRQEFPSNPPAMHPVLVELPAADVDRLWPGQSGPSTVGRKPIKTEQVAASMRERYAGTDALRKTLERMREKEMEATFGVSRNTARKARAMVLSEWDKLRTKDK